MATKVDPESIGQKESIDAAMFAKMFAKEIAR